MAREINLVPDIKTEMIKTLKMRNFIFFLCIVVSIASIAITAIAGLIAGSQQLVISSKQDTITTLSNKTNSFSDLSDYLTIKDQLGNISELTSNKRVFSRTFDILSAILPTGADEIKVSTLNVDFTDDVPTFSLEAQANSGKAPFIDYSVLESFKKSMQYMRYDYGNYVDKDGNTIPAYCMIESGLDGATLKDESKGIYAYWTINAEGCSPSSESDDNFADTTDSTDPTTDGSDATTNADNSTTNGYAMEEYDGQQVVRVWRTPQYDEWYKTTEIKGQPYMSLDGTISGVPHFESSCITYSGTTSENGSAPTWTESNESCLLVPDGADGMEIIESSNGRDESDELVLRFAANIVFAPEFFSFDNHHMLAIAPSGQRNVTDSYSQIQAMFSKRAADCDRSDTACNSTTNSGSTNNTNDNTSNNSDSSTTPNSSSSTDSGTNTNSNANAGERN